LTRATRNNTGWIAGSFDMKTALRGFCPAMTKAGRNCAPYGFPIQTSLVGFPVGWSHCRRGEYRNSL
jgi:hypothetical protein